MFFISWAGQLKALIHPHWRVINDLDDVSLAAKNGEIIGYLGPNGAGKSTTIKLLTGILHPTSGTVDLLEIQAFLHQPVRKLRLGQRMRADFVAALLHEPQVLFLDESTVGLDVLSKNRLLKFLQTLNTEKGVTIVLTTHNLSDMEQVCPRIVILDRGKIALDAPREEILQRFGKRRRLVIQFENGVRHLSLPHGQVVREAENELWVDFNRDQVSAFDLIASLGRDKGITDVAIKEETIESIVARLYQNRIEERR